MFTDFVLILIMRIHGIPCVLNILLFDLRVLHVNWLLYICGL